EAIPDFREILALLRQAQKLFSALAIKPGGFFLKLKDVSAMKQVTDSDGEKHHRFLSIAIAQAISQIENAMPAHTCCLLEFSDGGHPKTCPMCKGKMGTGPLSKTGRHPEQVKRACRYYKVEQPKE